MLLVGLLVAFTSACAKHSDSRQHDELAAYYLQAQHDYCSTNISVARRGTAEFRQWIKDPKNPCEPWLSRDSVLFQADARLFLIEEYLGETNMAEQFYRDGVEAWNRFVRKIPPQPQMLPQISTKEQLRDRIARQDKGLDVGWLNK